MKKVQFQYLPACVAALFAGSAGAAGFQLLEQNASGLGNAYAGSAAVAENASTIFFNPAGMTELKDREYSLGLTAIKPSFKFHDQGSSAGTLAAAGTGGDAGQLGLVPNAYLSWKLADRLFAGIGMSAPFGSKTEYNAPWVGSAHANTFDIKTYNLNPSLAWKVNEAVSIGVGLNYQHMKADYRRQLAVVAVVPPGLPGRTPLSVDIADSSWGWNVGGLFKLSPQTRLGVSYRSKIKHKLRGDISAASASAAVNAALATDAEAEVTLPDTFVASLVHQLNNRWQLLGDVSWTGWSSISELSIARTSGRLAGTVAQTLHTDFRDTWRMAVGANYRYSEAWTLKMGMAYDQTPVKSAASRLVSLPDNNRVWLSMGAQWKPSRASTVDFGLAYLSLKDAPINNNQSASGLGTVRGYYKDSSWILGVQYSQSF